MDTGNAELPCTTMTEQITTLQQRLSNAQIP